MKEKIFLKQFFPPFLLSALKKMILKRKKVYTASWHTIKGGILEGQNIFIDPSAGKWQKEMIDGIDDNFIICRAAHHQS